ncbi:hypothetical protein [Aquabacterium sp.]|uniref:hypothetical protein n=1 Tax=Aquabacterium sp. TaxID=1872578 RepID=UPI0035C6DD1F
MGYQTVRALVPIRHSGVLRIPGQTSGDNAQDFVAEDSQVARLVALGFVTSLGVAAAPAAPGAAASAAVTSTQVAANRALAESDIGVNLCLPANRSMPLPSGLNGGTGFNCQFSNTSAGTVTITVTPAAGVTLNGASAAVTRTLAAGQTTALIPLEAPNAYILPGV